MNFGLDDHQREIQRLASDVLARGVTPAGIERVEATPDRFDRDLWAELARTGLLGVGVPEGHDGLGMGVVEAALVCAEVGRSVAPVPFAAVSCAALVLAAHGSDAQQSTWLPRIARGEAVVVVVPEPSARDVHTGANGRMSGTLVGVPWAHVADALLVPGDGRVVVVDPAAEGVTAAPGETTAREVALDLVLDDVAVDAVGGDDAGVFLSQRWLTLLAATQAGVTEGALRLTADYTSRREQFGKPLSTFQGVALKAADAYIDVQAIRASALQAAWSLDAGLDATLPVLTAAWWAAEGGQHCVHLTQHLHGGMGADVTYPVHRYFLWGKQIELMSGGASALLAGLGDALATRPDAGDALVL
jgi:alkylation response protein AidB-like acyl-CoA dehydrogenase